MVIKPKNLIMACFTQLFRTSDKGLIEKKG